MIPFNIPTHAGNEEKYLKQAMKNRKLSGDGLFTKKCQGWFEKNLQCPKALLTTSCTHALDMSAILAEIKEGDEAIIPSYAFPSTASAFVLRGAKIVFLDIRPDTMNIDEKKIEGAITGKTRAIVIVHYAGISCEMDAIMDIARRHGLLVIEDAAQAVMSKYKGRFLGTIGDIGCYSFHETKNFTCGEGGAIVLNSKRFFERAEIIREKGTNRAKYFRGEVDKYTWSDIGSSYLPSELNAAYLYGQLEMADKINKDRLSVWNSYYQRLKPLENIGCVELMSIPEDCEHNGHMFYIKTKDLGERTRLIKYLKKHGIMTTFHFLPLHSSTAGLKFGRFHGKDRFTTKESERILRLPFYYGLKEKDVEKVVKRISGFYR
ncbi:MAG: dTDP-4-amino-4,6-dideoxygalactose transaminase [Candidatus Omnitrophota bacterium]|nr:dTDP-4-amino-4,6-dideoxygalactose transaminase [Candidatus Omnitrophota bacterium]